MTPYDTTGPTPTPEAALGLPWSWRHRDVKWTDCIVSTLDAPDECVLCVPKGEEFYPVENEWNFILRAANSHHALLAALKLARLHLCARIGLLKSMHSGWHSNDIQRAQSDLATIDAAIALAEEGK